MSQRRLLARATVGLAALGGVATLGCTNAGGPSFVTLGVDVASAPLELTGPDADPPSENDTALCVRLPVLLGSSIEKEEPIVGGLRAKIAATRDGADVTFPGADDRGGARSYTLSELRRGVLESVDIAADGRLFEASIVSNCTNP